MRSWAHGTIGRALGRKPSIGDPGSPLPAVRQRPTVHPVLPVVDMAEAIEFYRSLGFEVVAYDEGYAWVRHSGWELFHLVADEPRAGRSVAGLYLHVADVDAWQAALAASDADTAIGAVTDMPWGMREFSFSDPNGNVIRLGRNL